MSTPELDDKIFAQLNASPSTNRPWYNSLLLFLFPRDRRVYQYPSFQLALATVLVFGAVNLINFDNINDNTLAFEDVSKVKEKTISFPEQSSAEEIELATVDVSVETIVENQDKVIWIEETVIADDKDVDVLVKDLNEKFYAYDIMEEANEMELEDSEMVMEDELNEVVVDLKQEVTDASKKNLESDLVGNTNSAVVYKETELESEKTNEMPASVSTGSTTLSNTESRSDNDFKLKKDKTTSKSNEPVIASDDYSDGSAIQVASEQPEMEEKSISRKASINLSPELKQLFFEVK